MSSGFISESEILEARRRRQEEWDKVRTDDQPKEAPEEAYDSRPLFQRLEEQRLKKDAEYEEAHKLKNMIRGLDDDEVGFLELVERSKATAAMQISQDEHREMKEFRERVSSLAESEEMQRLRAQLAPKRSSSASAAATTAAAAAATGRTKLQGVVVRKRKASEVGSDSGKPDQCPTPEKINGVLRGNSNGNAPAAVPRPAAAAAAALGAGVGSGALRCVAVLPGMGCYGQGSDSSSDTGSDSDSDQDHDHQMEMCCTTRDLLGRPHELPPVESKRKEEAKS